MNNNELYAVLYDDGIYNGFSITDVFASQKEAEARKVFLEKIRPPFPTMYHYKVAKVKENPDGSFSDSYIIKDLFD